MEKFYDCSKGSLCIICRNEGELYVNKSMLSASIDLSKFLKIKSNIHVPDFDVEIFKMFLNVLMGFEKLGSINILSILPVVYKYNIEQLQEKICNFMKTTQDLRLIVLIFNIAVELNNDELINHSFDYLFRYGINRLFEEEEDFSYLMLEPKSVLFLIRAAEKSFLFLKRLQNWAVIYMMKNDIKEDMYTFLSAYKIHNLLMLDELKSVDMVLDLYHNDSKLDLFQAEDYLKRLKKISNDTQMKCEWVEIQEGKKFTELYELRCPVHINSVQPLKSYFRVSYNLLHPNENFVGKKSDIFKSVFIINGYEIVSANSKLEYRSFKGSLSNNGIFSSSKLTSIYFPVAKPSFCITSFYIEYTFLKGCTILRTKYSTSDNVCFPIKTKNDLSFTKYIELIETTDLSKLFDE